MGVVFGRPTQLQVLVLPLALLLLDAGQSGALQNVQFPGQTTTALRVGNYYRTTSTTSLDATNAHLRRCCYTTPNLSQSASLSATLPRRSPLFDSGVLSMQTQQRRVPLLLRLSAKDSEISSDAESNSRTRRVISKLKRILTKPFRKVATLVRSKKPDVLDMKITGEEGDSTTSSGSSQDESQAPTTASVKAVVWDVVDDDAVQVMEAPPISSPQPSPIEASTSEKSEVVEAPPLASPTPIGTSTTTSEIADDIPSPTTPVEASTNENSDDIPSPTTPIEVSTSDEASTCDEASSASENESSDADIIVGDRWAVAAPSVDLTGEWNIKPLMTEEFKGQYDNYLKLLGQPSLVRSVAVSIVGLTTEETVQSEQGRELLIRGRNVRGLWERTLTASGADQSSDEFTPLLTYIITADAEKVEAEAWWEDNGTVHRSWLRGVTKYGGGEFESKRYLEDDGNTLVCESTFHPADPSREKAQVRWRFQRAEVAA
jgi:hypothetical protein